MKRFAFYVLFLDCHFEELWLRLIFTKIANIHLIVLLYGCVRKRIARVRTLIQSNRVTFFKHNPNAHFKRLVFSYFAADIILFKSVNCVDNCAM